MTSETVMVPRKPTPEMLNAAVDVDAFKLGDISPLGFRISPQMLFERCWAAMLAATPPAQGEAVPFTYAHRYPVANGETVVRLDTGGREINGSRPIETIALYTAPPPVTGEGVHLRAFEDGLRLYRGETRIEGPWAYHQRSGAFAALAALTPAGGEG